MAEFANQPMQEVLEDLCKALSDVTFEGNKDAKNVCTEIKALCQEIESKKTALEDDDIKIVVIGKISCGKSTFINTLLERDLFSTTEGHGTPSFFICSKTEKDYEYFTINKGDNETGTEQRDMDFLQDCTRINQSLDSFLNQTNIIRVHITVGSDSILSNDASFVDCPGLGFNNDYDIAIQNYCKNADLFIFLFDVKEGATQNEVNGIEKWRDSFKNPSCLFVYNKCDELEDKSNGIKKAKATFQKDFPKLYDKNLKFGDDPLYMISLLQEREEIDKDDILHAEFERLEAAIKKHKRISCIRLMNIRSTAKGELTNLLKKISDLQRIVDDLRDEYNDKLKENPKENSALKEQMNKDIQVVRESKNVKKDVLARNVENIVHKTIKGFTETCNKKRHDDYLNKLSSKINDEIFCNIKSIMENDWLTAVKCSLAETQSVFATFRLQLTKDVVYCGANRNIQYGYFDSYVSTNTTDTVKKQYVEYVNEHMSTIRDSAVKHLQRQVDNAINDLEKCIKQYYESLPGMVNLKNTNQLEENKKRLEKASNMLTKYKETITKKLEKIHQRSR